MRLESQLKRCKTSSETAEKVEEELKQERRKLQREVRAAQGLFIIRMFNFWTRNQIIIIIIISNSYIAHVYFNKVLKALSINKLSER